jgi:hypothetical protein
VKSPVLKIYCADQCHPGSITVDTDPNVVQYYLERYENEGESIPSEQALTGHYQISLTSRLPPPSPLALSPLQECQHQYSQSFSLRNSLPAHYFSGGFFIPRGESYSGENFPYKSLPVNIRTNAKLAIVSTGLPPLGQAPAVPSVDIGGSSNDGSGAAKYEVPF